MPVTVMFSTRSASTHSRQPTGSGSATSATPNPSGELSRRRRNSSSTIFWASSMVWNAPWPGVGEDAQLNRLPGTGGEPPLGLGQFGLSPPVQVGGEPLGVGGQLGADCAGAVAQPSRRFIQGGVAGWRRTRGERTRGPGLVDVGPLVRAGRARSSRRRRFRRGLARRRRTVVQVAGRTPGSVAPPAGGPSSAWSVRSR